MSIILCGPSELLEEAAAQLYELHVEVRDRWGPNICAILCVPDPHNFSVKDKRRLAVLRKRDVPVYNFGEFIELFFPSSPLALSSFASSFATSSSSSLSSSHSSSSSSLSSSSSIPSSSSSSSSSSVSYPSCSSSREVIDLLEESDEEEEESNFKREQKAEQEHYESKISPSKKRTIETERLTKKLLGNILKYSQKQKEKENKKKRKVELIDEDEETEQVVKRKKKVLHKEKTKEETLSKPKKTMKKKPSASSSSSSSSLSSVKHLLGMNDPQTEEERAMPWKFRCSAAVKVRIERAQQQRLYLIQQSPLPSQWGSGKEFTVLGSTGNVYKVEIGDKTCCNCPDADKGNVCKHQLFVFLRVLRQPTSSPYIYQSALLSQERAVIFDEAPLQADVVAEKKVRDAYVKATKAGSKDEMEEHNKEEPTTHRGDAADDCAICFEALGSENLAVCPTCKNAIHSDCLARWRSASASNASCPLCRASWPSTSISTFEVATSRFLNLGAVAGLPPGPQYQPRQWWNAEQY